jgi:hypothetical protein
LRYMLYPSWRHAMRSSTEGLHASCGRLPAGDVVFGGMNGGHGWAMKTGRREEPCADLLPGSARLAFQQQPPPPPRE